LQFTFIVPDVSCAFQAPATMRAAILDYSGRMTLWVEKKIDEPPLNF
jgi:hypothetical protein